VRRRIEILHLPACDTSARASPRDRDVRRQLGERRVEIADLEAQKEYALTARGEALAGLAVDASRLDEHQPGFTDPETRGPDATLG
jgi:phage shock protein A